MTPTELPEFPGLIRSVSLKRGKGWFPHISLTFHSLTEGLLALPDSKNEDIFFTGGRVPLAVTTDQRMIPQWMIVVLSERLTDFLVLSAFVNSKIAVVDPNVSSFRIKNHLILHDLGCHAHRTTRFLLMF